MFVYRQRENHKVKIVKFQQIENQSEGCRRALVLFLQLSYNSEINLKKSPPKSNGVSSLQVEL